MVPTLLPTNTSDSLVINKKVDACCKVHDHCEHYIPRWKTKYHLVNWRPFTISSCECDHKFLKCLQQDDSLSAKDIKRIYFDILEVPCFKFELQDVRRCVERTWFMACKKFVMKTQLRAVLSSIDEYQKQTKTLWWNFSAFPLVPCIKASTLKKGSGSISKELKSVRCVALRWHQKIFLDSRKNNLKKYSS